MGYVKGSIDLSSTQDGLLLEQGKRPRITGAERADWGKAAAQFNWMMKEKSLTPGALCHVTQGLGIAVNIRMGVEIGLMKAG
jgi:hypothetical protein